MGKTYRASSAPLYATCPGAAYDETDEVLINPADDAGTLGSAVHAVCAQIATRSLPALYDIGQKYSLDPAQAKELQILSLVALRFWGEYGQQFNLSRAGTPRVEAEMWHRDADGNTISGHQDVIGAGYSCAAGQSEKVCRVLDWKTTRLESVNYRPQMMEYLWLARQAAAPCSPGKEARFSQYVICFLRDKTIEVSKEFTADEVEQWHADYMAGIKSWDGRTYHPGRHCVYCPRRATCPGLCSELALLCDGFHLVEAAVAELPAETKVELWERIGSAQKFLDHAREIIKLHAEAAGGTLQGNGKVLILKDQQRQTIKTREAWPIILNHLTEAELAPAVTINKTTLLDAVADKAPRGGKKRAKDMLMDELTAAGAVETTTYQVSRIVAALPAATETTITETESEE